MTTGLSVALDERDRPTQEHCARVSGLAADLGAACQLSEQELRWLQRASVLHDVGKIGIPDQVLRKKAKFDDADWAVMKTHSGRSERIVQAAGLDDVVALAVRHHHERFDGSGYPDGLAGEQIPVLSRIIAIADAYDAMARLREYGFTRAHAAILEELRRHEGRQHDPYLLGKFFAVIEHSGFLAPR